MAQTSFAYYPVLAGAHVQIRVFAGEDEQHRALCGTLTMRPVEWADFTDRIMGLGHTIAPMDAGAAPEGDPIRGALDRMAERRLNRLDDAGARP